MKNINFQLIDTPPGIYDENLFPHNQSLISGYNILLSSVNGINYLVKNWN